MFVDVNNSALEDGRKLGVATRDSRLATRDSRIAPYFAGRAARTEPRHTATNS